MKASTLLLKHSLAALVVYNILGIKVKKKSNQYLVRVFNASGSGLLQKKSSNQKLVDE